MKTGKHEEVKQFISSHSLQDQTFDLESEYYRLHNYDLESYDRRLAIVDVRHDNHRLKDNDEFQIEFEGDVNYYIARGLCLYLLHHGSPKTILHRPNFILV